MATSVTKKTFSKAEHLKLLLELQVALWKATKSYYKVGSIQWQYFISIFWKSLFEKNKTNLQLFWIKKNGDKEEKKERWIVKKGLTETGYYWLHFIISNRRYKRNY